MRTPAHRPVEISEGATQEVGPSPSQAEGFSAESAASFQDSWGNQAVAEQIGAQASPPPAATGLADLDPLLALRLRVVLSRHDHVGAVLLPIAPVLPAAAFQRVTELQTECTLLRSEIAADIPLLTTPEASGPLLDGLYDLANELDRGVALLEAYEMYASGLFAYRMLKGVGPVAVFALGAAIVMGPLLKAERIERELEAIRRNLAELPRLGLEVSLQALLEIALDALGGKLVEGLSGLRKMGAEKALDQLGTTIDEALGAEPEALAEHMPVLFGEADAFGGLCDGIGAHITEKLTGAARDQLFAAIDLIPLSDPAIEYGEIAMRARDQLLTLRALRPRIAELMEEFAMVPGQLLRLAGVARALPVQINDAAFRVITSAAFVHEVDPAA